MRKRFAPVLLGGLILAGGLALAACTPQQPAAQAPEAKTYPVTGEVLGFQSENRVVILKHEEIPGLMQAMTMGFELGDPKLAAGLKKGDKVEATLTVSDDAYVITALKKK